MTTRDAWKAALWTALFTFVGMFGLALLGWLTDVWSWAQDDKGVVLFPDPNPLFKGTVSAVVAALIGLVNFVVRWAQAKGLLPGRGTVPSYRG